MARQQSIYGLVQLQARLPRYSLHTLWLRLSGTRVPGGSVVVATLHLGAPCCSGKMAVPMWAQSQGALELLQVAEAGMEAPVVFRPGHEIQIDSAPLLAKAI